MLPSALKLANELGISQEHPDYPVVDWQHAVSDGETRDGYWDWVIHTMRYEHHAWLDGDAWPTAGDRHARS